ncbi:MAG: ParA family protein [Candidatus Omnitrophota bacterium]|nr:MAG: ParA family protein [Candidatus Omnitrophota bacterium]RKY36377.1 MAG: ParA family protein [Candidatus Omnitrophota bacterium]RKY45890.1 MAG: ParA family protein [Candidatus Omnitrophota bacterium]HDN85838.1 ParA family protein [Candidatus Omnitrophota bacterium]
MKVISILNQKGGCSKTTTAVNLSYALAKNNYPTLVIDFDPQAHTTFCLGISSNKGICEVMENFLAQKSIPWQECIVKREENLFVLPASIGLTSMEHKLAEREDKLFILYKILNSSTLAYQYCIVDCPPNLGLLSLNALIGGNFLIIPFTVCDLSLQGITILNQIIEMMKKNLPIHQDIFYLLTQYNKRFHHSNQFLERARNSLKDRLLKTIIRTNVALKEASSLGKSIFEHKPRSRGACDYQNLAQEIINLTQEVEWANFFFKGNNFKEVYVVGDFTKWQKEEKFRMKKIDWETWSISVPLKKGKYCYKFFADQTWLKDPFNVHEEDDSFGGKNSVLVIK